MPEYEGDVFKGKIQGFAGSWQSGLGYLIIEDSDTGEVQQVPCDNAPTVRALEACFGNVIGNAHDVKRNAGFTGKEVYWSYDEFGIVLGGFSPVEEAHPEVVAQYEKSLKGRRIN